MFFVIFIKLINTIDKWLLELREGEERKERGREDKKKKENANLTYNKSKKPVVLVCFYVKSMQARIISQMRKCMHDTGL